MAPSGLLAIALPRISSYFFKIVAVRHLGFVGRILRPSAKNTWRSLSSDKIRLESIE